MLYRWIYVSRSRIAEAHREDAISEIVEYSRERNASLKVTGALISTSNRFAQLLEGGEPEVLTLQESIRRDPRHENVTSVPLSLGQPRLFASWSLLYSGASQFMQSILDGIKLECHAQRNSSTRALKEMFLEFSTDRTRD